jgi:hypothetical protein
MRLRPIEPDAGPLSCTFQENTMRKIILATVLLTAASTSSSATEPRSGRIELQCAGAADNTDRLQRCLDQLADAVRLLWEESHGLSERGLGGANGKGLGDNQSSR